VFTPTRLIRAISVIAHVDHGKTTLSDRLLEYTGTVAQRDMVEQVLDQLDLERERGITIKAQAVRMLYKADDGNTYQINLIDTPGHVDFSYEVSRALAACDGAVLVVDASQGIEAQTIANVHQALDHKLKIVPVVNKIDLPQANPELVREEIEKVIGLPAESVIFASARQGIGTKEILEAVVRDRRSGGAVTGADLRREVRCLPRCRHLRPCPRGHPAQGRQNFDDANRQELRS